MASLARYPSLVDRVVLITGGSTGIGATLVEQFVEQGARVGFIDIDVPHAEALVKQLTPRAKTPPLFVRADISDVPRLEAAIDVVRERLGPITVLLNNAANDVRHKIEDTTSQSWDAGIAVNLKHQFFA
ncbi:MAG TPA: SDR family NAD(P)-dependent oxidoreductase, partial [Burkholderiaceae bacterium]